MKYKHPTDITQQSEVEFHDSAIRFDSSTPMHCRQLFAKSACQLIFSNSRRDLIASSLDGGVAAYAHLLYISTQLHPKKYFAAIQMR